MSISPSTIASTLPVYLPQNINNSQYTLTSLLSLSKQAKIQEMYHKNKKKRIYRSTDNIGIAFGGSGTRDSYNSQVCKGENKYFDVKSPFYDRGKEKKYRKSQHLCSMENPMPKQSKQFPNFLKKGSLSQHQQAKKNNSHKLRSLHESNINPHKLQPTKHPFHKKSLNMKQKQIPCLISCGLFKIKCCNCRPELDCFNFQFEEYLRKRGYWSAVGLGKEEKREENKVKGYILEKLISSYLNIMKEMRDKSKKSKISDMVIGGIPGITSPRKLSNFSPLKYKFSNLELKLNNKGKNKEISQLQELKSQLQITSVSIMRDLYDYINELNLGKKQKLMLYDWSENINNIFKKEIVTNYLEKNLRKKGGDDQMDLMDLKEKLNKIYDNENYTEEKTDFLRRIRNKNKGSSIKKKQRHEKGTSSDQKSQQEQNNGIKNKKNVQNEIILRLDKPNDKNSVKSKQKQRNKYQTTLQTGFHSKSKINTLSSKRILKKNHSKQISDYQDQQQHNKNANLTPQQKDLTSLKVLKKKKQSKRIRDSKRNSIDENYIDRQCGYTVKKEPDRHRNSIMLSIKKTLHRIGTHKNINFHDPIPVLLPQQSNQPLQQRQFEFEPELIQNIQPIMLQFPIQFEQLCGSYKLKIEPKPKIRHRRIGVILQSLQVSPQNEQFAKFKKQVIKNHALQNRIQKVLSQISCNETIMRNNEATLNISRKTNLIREIMNKDLNKKSIDTLEFYISIFRKNHQLRLKKGRPHRLHNQQNQDLNLQSPQAQQPHLDTPSQPSSQTLQNFLHENHKKLLQNDRLMFYTLTKTSHDDLYQCFRQPDSDQQFEINKGKDCEIGGFIMERVHVRRKDAEGDRRVRIQREEEEFWSRRKGKSIQGKGKGVDKDMGLAQVQF